MSTTIYAKSFSWNGTTYTSGVGGLVEITFSHEGTPVEDGTGTDEYPTFGQVANKRVRVSVTTRTWKLITALGATKANGTAIVNGKNGDETLTIANLLLFAVGPATQRHAEPGASTLQFFHESADGTTNPLS